MPFLKAWGVLAVPSVLSLLINLLRIGLPQTPGVPPLGERLDHLLAYAAYCGALILALGLALALCWRVIKGSSGFRSVSGAFGAALLVSSVANVLLNGIELWLGLTGIFRASDDYWEWFIDNPSAIVMEFVAPLLLHVPASAALAAPILAIFLPVSSPEGKLQAQYTRSVLRTYFAALAAPALLSSLLVVELLWRWSNVLFPDMTYQDYSRVSLFLYGTAMAIFAPGVAALLVFVCLLLPISPWVAGSLLWRDDVPKFSGRFWWGVGAVYLLIGCLFALVSIGSGQSLEVFHELMSWVPAALILIIFLWIATAASHGPVMSAQGHDADAPSRRAAAAVAPTSLVDLEGAILTRGWRAAWDRGVGSGVVGAAFVFGVIATALIILRPLVFYALSHIPEWGDMAHILAQILESGFLGLALLGSLFSVIAAPVFSYVTLKVKAAWALLLAVGIVLSVLFIGWPRLHILGEALAGNERTFIVLYGFVLIFALLSAGLAFFLGLRWLLAPQALAQEGFGLSRRPQLSTWRAAARRVLGAPGYIDAIPGARGSLSLWFLAGAAFLAAPVLAPFGFLSYVNGVAQEIAPVGFAQDPFAPTVTQETSEASSVFWVLLGIIVVAIMMGVTGTALLRHARRRASRLYQAVQLSDERAPILYLRSFRQDGRPLAQDGRGLFQALLPKAGEVETLDEILLEGASQRGPLVAIGKPGEPLPPLGAARRYCSGDEWTGVVMDLARAADLIVLSVDDTNGVRWEVSLLVREGLGEKALFFFNPNAPEAARRQMLADLGAQFGKPTPDLASGQLVAAALHPTLKEWMVFVAPAAGRNAHACALNWALAVREFPQL